MRPLLLLFTFWFGSALLAGCSEAIPRKGSTADEEIRPQVSMQGVRVLSWEGDQLVATGTMATLTYDRSSSNFEGADVVFRFSDLGLRAPRATGNLSSKQADGIGGVLLRSSSGLRATTDRAHLDGVGLVASGDTRIDATGPGFDVTAEGFRYDIATETLVFEGDVQSRLGGAGGSNR